MPEKILVVDDELDTLKLVGMMLESKGYEIIAASNGQKALTLAKNELPNLILLDVLMPGMDGYEVTRRLRQDEATNRIPIIMFTAKHGMDSRVLGLEAGADAYLTKPISTRELLAHVKAILGRASKGKDRTFPYELGHTLAVLSTRGGAGATTIALNLGVALQKCTQKSVIVAEYRPGQGSLGLELGFGQPFGLNRLLQISPAEISRRAVEAELVNHPAGIRLLLSSSQPMDARYAWATSNFEAITHFLAQIADYVVLDLGPGLNPTSEKVLVNCRDVLIVIEPLPQSVILARSLLEDLSSLGISPDQVHFILANRVRSELHLTPAQIQEQLGYEVAVNFTPEPELAYQASSNNAPMILIQPQGQAAQQYFKLAEVVYQRTE
jgi:CheY-like chemotaxis protein/MinD-like ATPase involved in chromosome partitioning or flagellar assembly